MSISIEEVNRIAKLAKLSFSDEEKQKFTDELSKILDYVGQVQKLSEKTDDKFSLNDQEGINMVREDVAVQTENPQKFLEQAAGMEGKFLKVKSILE